MVEVREMKYGPRVGEGTRSSVYLILKLALSMQKEDL